MTIERVPVRRGPRGPYAKSRRTRTSILDSALEVFAESGYRSGSLREVAERVGMSEAGLLHHFTNKSGLLAAVLERRDEQTVERFDFEPEHGRDLLRSTIELVEYNASTPGVVELYCTLSAEATSPGHPAHQYFVDRYVATVTIMRRALEAMQALAELRPGVSPQLAARGIVALMDGLQIQWLLDRDSVDMAADLRSYLNLLVVHEL